MTDGARVLRPDRDQTRLEVVDLDSLLGPDHPARVVWAFVSSLDLGAFYDQIKARDSEPGRPASDPAVQLALFLYGLVEGIGSARLICSLSEHHAAYRWLRGGVPVNPDMLCNFRRNHTERLDKLFSSSLAALVSEGLVELTELRIDATKAAARAGRGSLARSLRLSRLEQQMTERVSTLKTELEADPGASGQRLTQRRLRHAQETLDRLGRARETLNQRLAEKSARAKKHAAEEKAKGEPAVSTSDPSVRQMRMADGAVRPAWNVRVATACGFVVGIEPTDRRNDSGMARPLVEEVERRCGDTPERLLADGTAVLLEEIVALAESRPALTIYTPPQEERTDITPGARRNRESRLRHEPEALKQWRARMASAAGKAIYRRRKLTEHAHAYMKNRGFGRMPVHGLGAVRAVCLLHALALNMMRAHRLRTSLQLRAA